MRGNRRLNVSRIQFEKHICYLDQFPSHFVLDVTAHKRMCATKVKNQKPPFVLTLPTVGSFLSQFDGSDCKGIDRDFVNT